MRSAHYGGNRHDASSATLEKLTGPQLVALVQSLDMKVTAELRARDTFIAHIAKLHARNVKLQERLDELNASIARKQIVRMA